MSPTPKRRSGFTLLEVLLVLAILGVIAAIVVPQLIGRQREALIKASRTSIAGLEGALKLYAAEHDGEYPVGSHDEVFALLTNPGNGSDGRPISPFLEELPRDALSVPGGVAPPRSIARVLFVVAPCQAPR